MWSAIRILLDDWMKLLVNLWKSWSLRSKLLAQSVIACAVVLIFACMLLVMLDQYRQREALDENLRVIGQVLGENSAAAMVFDDTEAAGSTLSRLSTHRSVLAACMYRIGGDARQPVWHLLAQYRREKASLLICPPEGGQSLGMGYGKVFAEGKNHFLAHDVTWDGQRVGEVTLVADLSEQDTRLHEYSLMAATVVLIAVLVAGLLSAPFVRMLLKPLLLLHDTAHRIAEKENYQLRAEKITDDEIGDVVDAFNGMLDIIEHNHLVLRENEEKFRLLSEAAAFGIFQLDEKGVIVYCNRQLCFIAGIARDVIMQKGLMPAVHPEDEDLFLHLFENVIASCTSLQIEGRILHKDGSVLWVSVRLSPILDVMGNLAGYMGAVSDISDIKAVHEQLEQMAFFDPLTKLANRRLFRVQLEKALLDMQRSGRGLALLLLDIDMFKHVNDSLGHDIGDELLVEIAKRLRTCVRVTDTVSRLGGDEFVLLIEDVDSVPFVSRVARSIVAAFDEPLLIGENEIRVTTSMGIVIAPRDGDDEKQLLKNADLALYECKESGRNSYRFFTAEMNRQLENYLSLEKDLRNAIEREEFILHYQPQIDLGSNRLKGFEALLRWRHPQRGLVSPLDFIPVAEQTGHIVQIGRWVLREAVRQLLSLRKSGVIGDEVVMAVNLSARQFSDKNLVRDIENILSETGLAPGNLELELTESILMENIGTATETLQYLRDRGVLLSVDDFGTGYSSLSYLKKLPIHIVKVDRSFVKDIPQDHEDMEITAAIVAMTHRLNYKVVAEGVETQAQLQFLRECGCDMVQGYLISKPLPFHELELFCQHWHGQEMLPRYLN